MRTLKLTLAYDGTNYAGWQFQLNQPTLQHTLEQAIAKITGETLRVIASGRTDAGVHALAQVVSFQTNSAIAVDAMQRALNCTLPYDMCVLEVCEAPSDFHPIVNAKRKRYRYVISDGSARDVFALRYAWHIHVPLNEADMREAGACLVGQHDFSSFQATGSRRQSNVRTVYDFTLHREASWLRAPLMLEIEADGFLYNMVRIIAGTLVEVGRGNQRPDWVAQVLAARNRLTAGATAPAHGLYLMWVKYDS